MKEQSLRVAVATVTLLFVAASWPTSSAIADPPPWAPAHGYRDKHHHHHDEDDDNDGRVVVVQPPPAVVAPAPAVAMPYGLAQNTCHRDLVGAAIGGAAGGLIGSNIGKSSGRTVATIGGVLVGAFVGGAIGRSMDEADQACVGQVLQYTPDQQTVVWQGPNQQGYWVTPMRSYSAGGRYCREYVSRSTYNGQVQVVTSHACRGNDGAWAIVD